MTYTPSMVRSLLSGYQRRAQGARQQAPEDRLGTKAPPLHEAPWAASSCQWADIEQAMQNLPFNWEKIVWEVVCVGESSARNGSKRYDWRRHWADWWGMTAGDVNKIVDEAIQEMCDSLNGADSTNDAGLAMIAPLVDGKSETVVEHDAGLPDLVDTSLSM